MLKITALKHDYFASGLVFLNYYGYICSHINNSIPMNKKVIQVKRPNGAVYLYEDHSYWDKERRYSTHKRKCIGKLDADGKPVYNEFYRTRERMASLEQSVTRTTPVSSTTLEGQRLVLEKEAKKINIRKVLEATLGKNDSDKIMALAYYLICRGKSLSRSTQWLEDRGFGDLKLTSQRISEVLGSLSDDRINTFFKEWIGNQNDTKKNYLFDITSVSTYGKDNPWAEYGYNRDRENLEQINLSMLTSCISGLPLWYDVLPGSMSDVAVMDATLGKLKKLDTGAFVFCGDRGFFSDRNLKILTDRGIRFTIPVPSSRKIGRELIKENRDSMIHPSFFIDGENTKVYGKTVFRKTEHGRTWYHIYFDPARKDMIQASFMLKLRKCKDELESGNTVESHKSIYDEYFIVKDTPKRGLKVSYNDEALNEYLNNDSCWWVLMSTAEKNAAKALESYRKRGEVELSFDDMKNLLDLNRLRNHNEHTVKGKIFVNFIALAILSRLRRTIDAIPAKDRMYMSETDVLDRVETYTRVHFDGKYKDVWSTPTKTQRLIFDKLGIKYEYKGEEANSDPVAPKDL